MNKGKRLGSKDLMIMSKKSGDNLTKVCEMNFIKLNNSELRYMGRRKKIFEELFRDIISNIKPIKMDMKLSIFSLIKVIFVDIMTKCYHMILS